MTTLAVGASLAPAAGATARDTDPTLDQVLSGRHVLRSTSEIDELVEHAGGNTGERLLIVTDDGADGREIQTVAVPADDLDALSARIDAVPGVVGVGPDVRVTSQWNDTYASRQYSPSRIRANRLPTTATGDGIVVAVIDSGVNGNHVDLTPQLPGGRARVLPGTTFLTTAQGNVDPRTGTPGNRDLGTHGTHVAGIIAAARDNNLGIAGAAPDAQILPVRVLDQSGAGWMSDVLYGMEYAFDQGADVINLSLAGAISDPRAVGIITDWVNDIRQDTSRGKPAPVIVAAAGNTGPNSPTMYPAAIASVLAVASTDAADTVAASSTRGNWVDLAAPGVNIFSTCGSGYCSMSGTSMASPLVAAAAAILLQQNPNRTDVQSVLETRAVDVDVLGRDRSSGAGRLDIAAAFDPVTSPPLVRRLTTVTGSVSDVRFERGSINVIGTVRDPEGAVTVVTETTGPGGKVRRTRSVNPGAFNISWAATSGDYRVCTSVLDNPNGTSVSLGCRNVVVK